LSAGVDSAAAWPEARTRKPSIQFDCPILKPTTPGRPTCA